MKTLAVLAATGAVSTAFAFLQPPGQQDRSGPPMGPPPHGGPFLELFDTDRSGELSAEEIDASAKVLAALDQNNDGKLTSDELPRPPHPPNDRARDDRGPRDFGPPQHDRRGRGPEARGPQGPRDLERGDHGRRGEGPRDDFDNNRGPHRHGPRHHDHADRNDGPRDHGPPPRLEDNRRQGPPEQRPLRQGPPPSRGQQQGDRSDRDRPPLEQPGVALNTVGTVRIEGGFEIGPNDYGRPVSLIAAALGVQPDVFRQAFSGVSPARGGEPSSSRIRSNKEALMSVLEPHGIANSRLDEVSNYYRFRPQAGEIWPHKRAQAEAIVKDGKVTGFRITEPGSGYTVPPTVKVAGHSELNVRVTLEFGEDLTTNGRVASLTVVD